MKITEQLQGETLRDRLKREHRLPLTMAVRLAREAATALVEMHAGGSVHGSICLDNLRLDSSGSLHLVAAGWATAEDLPLLERLGMASAGGLISPEQATGEPVTPAADLFGLGCVLYQLLTGELPFHGDNATAITRSIVFFEPKPARDLNPEVPEGLSRLISQLLAKMPARRPASAAEVVDRLTEWLEPTAHTPERFSPPPSLYPASKRILETIGGNRPLPEQQATEHTAKAVVILAPPPSERKRRWWVDVLAGVVLTAAAVGLYFWWKASDAPAPAPAAAKQMR